MIDKLNNTKEEKNATKSEKNIVKNKISPIKYQKTPLKDEKKYFTNKNPYSLDPVNLNEQELKSIAQILPSKMPLPSNDILESERENLKNELEKICIQKSIEKITSILKINIEEIDSKSDNEAIKHLYDIFTSKTENEFNKKEYEILIDEFIFLKFLNLSAPQLNLRKKLMGTMVESFNLDVTRKF